MKRVTDDGELLALAAISGVKQDLDRLVDVTALVAGRYIAPA